MTKLQFLLIFLKIVEMTHMRAKLQMRAKEDINHQQFFSTNKQYLKIKPMQNETNRWSIFLVMSKYW